MKRSLRTGLLLAAALSPLLGTPFCGTTTFAADEPRVNVLFLGDDGHHQPRARFGQLQPVLAKRGIDLVYTDRVGDLNPETLAKYDGLAIFANIERIEPAQEKALLDYVAGGKGLIPIHCASYCFLNSPKYVALVGAQFQKHGTGTFRTELAKTEHEILRDFGGFESWDETYVHHRHNEEGRTVLSYRVDESGREPWTWVRTEGEGRVFYTAWGHDARTWGNPGFENLIERGIRWAVGGDVAVVPPFGDDDAFPIPKITAQREDVEPFEFTEAEIPFYPPSARWGTLGEPLREMQNPLSPEESMKHFVMPEGFDVELFAAEPDLGGKPIAVNWDDRGRLWVAETFDYPNEIQPEGKGRDRIRICEDTDGDGRADKFTVFAENLSIPTSLLCIDGGVIVHQAPDTLFLRDTDGDDRADVREVLFTGWSTRDTHAGPSNLRYGLDNWIWGMVGYSGFEGRVGGERHSFRSGFYRFKPDGSKMEFIRNVDNNAWGVGISEDGVVFGSTANRNPSVYVSIPNRYYESVRGWSSSVLPHASRSHLFTPSTEKVRQVDQHGGYTAGAGHALYTARAWPREYWNDTAFVCGPTGHLVGTFHLQRDGADVESKYLFNQLASDDEWSAPIIAEVGPDGQLWVVDWYNYIVQHNPTPQGYRTGKGGAYETDLRDKRHGRVYRLVYTGDDEPAGTADTDAGRPGNLGEASSGELVATLTNPTMFWRLHAQRLLVERGDRDVVPQLLDLVRDESVDEIGLNVGAIHALRTLEGMGVLTDDIEATQVVVEAGLKHPSAGVRRNAVAALPPTQATGEAIVAAGLLGDADAQVRLATLLALADVPGSETVARAVATALVAPSTAGDRWLADAATAAAAAHAGFFLRAAPQVEGRSPALLAAVERVAEHFARNQPGEPVGPVLVAIAGGPVPIADATVNGLARGWPAQARATLDEPAEKSLVALVTTLAPGPRSQLVRLGERWGSDALRKHAAEIARTFLAVVSDEDAADADRVRAATQLVAFDPQNGEVVESLLKELTPRSSPTLVDGLIAALAGSRAENLGGELLDRIGDLTPGGRRAALRLLLGSRETAADLVAALDSGAVAASDLTLDQKQSLVTHPDDEIAARAKTVFARGGGLPDPDRQKVLERLLPVAARTGDAAHGLEVFKKQCMKCHVHGEIGTRIGPDLTGMAVHPKAELLTQVLDPSRNVEGNFRVYTVVMDSGRVFNGLLASESRTSLELFDTEGKKQLLLREEVEEIVASKKSLMPEGFEKQLSPDDFADLLEFLTQRGRYVPIPLAKAATAVSTTGMFISRDADAERLIFPDWTPKTFAGVPFQLVDPQGTRVPNVILLNGPNGTFPPNMPKRVELPCNMPAKAIHLLSGVSGWGHPYSEARTVSMIVRLHYADGETEDHELRNGEHFADYIRRVDVPRSKFAFALRGQQIRYLAVEPRRAEPIETIELVKGPDDSAPVVMAVTVEPIAAMPKEE